MIDTFWEGAVVLLAGMAAGTINTVVGSGTLVTFPILLAFGVPPVTANVSNNIGLVPGALSGPSATAGSSSGSAPARSGSARRHWSGLRSVPCCCSSCREAPSQRSCRL